MLCTVMDRLRSDFGLFVLAVGAARTPGRVGAVLGRQVAPHALAWERHEWERVRETRARWIAVLGRADVGDTQ
jgi:hypothetical protein